MVNASLANDTSISDLVQCDQNNQTCSDCLVSEKCVWIEDSDGGDCVPRVGWNIPDFLREGQKALLEPNDCQDSPAYVGYLKIAAVILVVAFVTVILLVFIVQKVRLVCRRRAEATINNKEKDVQEPMVPLDTTNNST